MGNPIRTFHGHAGGNTETPTPGRGFPRRRAIPDAFTSLLVGGTFFFVALTGVTGRCSEFGAPAYPAEDSPRLRVLPVSQSEYPGRTAAQEPSWIRITSTQIQFATFTLTLSDQTIPVRSQSLVPTISVDALAGRVATTLAFVQDGLSGQPRMTTEPLVFVFADEDVGDSAAPILVASFFRGFLHGPVWLLHPDTGNPIFFGEYERGTRTGRFLVYDPDGSQGLRFFAEYKNNRRHGLAIALEEGRPMHVAYYQKDGLLGEWCVEWPSTQPEVLPAAALPAERIAALRRGQRVGNWAQNLILKCEPPIKQLVVQVYRKIDLEIKRRLAAAHSVAARERIIARYEQLSAAQKAFHASVLERASAGTGGAAIYGSIAAEARCQLARASVRNMNAALNELTVGIGPLQRSFRESVVVVIRETVVLLPEDD